MAEVPIAVAVEYLSRNVKEAVRHMSLDSEGQGEVLRLDWMRSLRYRRCLRTEPCHPLPTQEDRTGKGAW